MRGKGDLGGKKGALRGEQNRRREEKVLRRFVVLMQEKVLTQQWEKGSVLGSGQEGKMDRCYDNNWRDGT